MSDWRDQLPDPTARWTEHDDGFPTEVRIRITERSSKTVRSGDNAGKSFELLVGTDLDNNGRMWDVPAARSGLRQIVEQEDPRVGDVLALAYHGMSGHAYVYAGRVLERAEA
ncbi:MAG: hypothetical protein ABR529_15420 [Actinomycetota bacterium]